MTQEGLDCSPVGWFCFWKIITVIWESADNVQCKGQEGGDQHQAVEHAEGDHNEDHLEEDDKCLRRSIEHPDNAK